MRQIVDKIGAILALYSFERSEWGVSELARELSMPKSSVSELMTSLATQGLVERSALGRYRLGWRFFTLNQVLLESTPLVRESRPVMHELVERHGETSHLMVLDRRQAVIVEKVQGTLATQILMSRVGIRLPAHCSACGKLLLAQLDWDEVVSLFGDAEPERFTPRTLVSLPTLADELARIREQGHALDREEIVPGLTCVAAPVRDATGRTIAAISVSTPTYRFIEQETVPIARRAADRISLRLGWHEPVTRPGRSIKETA